MKKSVLIFALICFILPKPPMSQKSAHDDASKPAAFVVEAGRYAWAWVNARYYTCFSYIEKET
ncbi:MAG TPA: hypothetical protein VN626_11545 [Clostridia bacterium]|nr:hypothetical protein [Clostridia bacterium]